MPNTLAHAGVQALLTRGAARGVDVRWALLGCVLPDAPWIARRALVAAVPPLDGDALLLVATAQASLVCTLLLAGAVALLARTPGVVFAVLAGNAALHLVLDGLQTKWGSPAYLLAPFAWHDFAVDLFWPESAVTLGLTLLGLGVCAAAVLRAPPTPLLARPAPGRALAAAALLAAWIALPLALAPQALEADAHSVRALRERSPGARLELDRMEYEHAPTPSLVLHGDGRLPLAEPLPVGRDARVSVRGRLRDADTLVVEAHHVHRGAARDVASLLGLGLIALAWLRGVRPRAGAPR